MSKQQILTGLDIGSGHIRVVVAEISETRELNIVSASASSSEGINKGVITSLEDAITSISVALEQAERVSGCPIERAAVSVSGHHITTQTSRGVVAVGKVDGEIQQSDIDRVLDAAQTISTPANYEIIHAIPKSFTVDDQEGVKDPYGMSGIRLEVDTLLVEGLSNQIKNLTKAVYRSGLDIDALVVGILACAEACLDKRQKELGVALVNIGASTTSIVVYENGELLHVGVIPIGSGHITSDIAIGLRVSVDVAERIKLQEGTALAEQVSKREEINLHTYDSSESDRVSRRHVAEIIQARVDELYGLIHKELESVGKAGMLPAGIVYTGAGCQLPGMVDAAKDYFKLPVILANSVPVSSLSDSVKSPAYSTALGLVLWMWNYRDNEQMQAGGSKNVKHMFGSITKWFKNLLP